jgi:nickel-dependent lactate racemase
MVGNAIDQPVSGASLGDRAKGRTSATIIVPDTTRKLPLREILPVILQNLVGAGIRDSKITILIACGTHPGVGAGETRALIGELPAGISVVEHDSRSANELVTVGELRPGIPLRLNRAAIETDLLITVGAIRHHYFAGFGGGPKMVFPGVAGHDEIQANHSLVLATGDDGSRIRDPRCEPGILDGNPVAEEIARAADIRPPDMAICLLEGGHGTPAWVGAGPWRPSFDAAVARARSWFEIDGAGPFDFMVASGGGAPTDSTLIQAHKGLDAACRFLAPGGRLLYVAAIDRGAGSEAMLPFLQDPDPEAILARLAETWVQYGHTTLRLLEKTSRFEVALHSRLEPDVARRLGFEPVLAVQDVINAWREESPGATIGVMASGAVYPCP